MHGDDRPLRVSWSLDDTIAHHGHVRLHGPRQQEVCAPAPADRQ
jgi:hypothetical protein